MSIIKRELYIFPMYLLAVIGILISVSSFNNNIWMNLLLMIFWLFSFTLRNLFIYKTNNNNKYAAVTYIIEVFLLFVLSCLNAGDSIKILFFITLGDFFISCRIKPALLFWIVVFQTYIFHILISHPLNTKVFILILIKESPGFLLVGLVAGLFGSLLKSSSLAEESMKAIQIREAELKEAYHKIQKAYETLEEMTALKERITIAREIHDTVGHTLTTVIIEMEAGRMLLEKNTDLALGKFLMAQKQASKALDELRRSVSLLVKKKAPVSLKEAILSVCEETHLHTGVIIKSILDISDKVPEELAHTIVRFLKEGLANGIRHGGGTAFLLKIVEKNNQLSFLLQDNGIGCRLITLGFGLSNIKESIEKLGGIAQFYSEEGNGFEIRFDLPMQKEGCYGEDKSDVG